MTPQEMTDLDMDHLQSWAGRTETHTDLITDALIERFRATFFDKLWGQDDQTAPLGLHWCLAPQVAPGNALGSDGHPKRGGFLPPVPLPSRMWAGGELTFHATLRAGDRVTRNSKIASVTLKQGKSGPLVFVAVEHQCLVGDQLVITERQDLVYKQANVKPAINPEASTSQQDQEPIQVGELMVGSVELFRYSALTFNGHRIHYDRDYARSEEGYAGLVVHGPFQATLLMNRAAQMCGGVPKRFAFRGLAPMIEQTRFELLDQPTEKGGEVWCETNGGVITMKAEYWRE